jgi:hypothetical protein
MAKLVAHKAAITAALDSILQYCVCNFNSLEKIFFNHNPSGYKKRMLTFG